MWWTATFECVSDSTHYGKKGNTNTLGNIQAPFRDAAIAEAAKQCPGNWRVTGIGEQSHRCAGDCYSGTEYICDIGDILIESINVPSEGGWMSEGRWLEFAEEIIPY